MDGQGRAEQTFPVNLLLILQRQRHCHSHHESHGMIYSQSISHNREHEARALQTACIFAAVLPSHPYAYPSLPPSFPLSHL